MHQELGAEKVRPWLIERKQFLSSVYVPEEVYVMTTDRQRTIISATSQLEGLYGMALQFPDVDPTFNLTNVPDSHNSFTHLTSVVCERQGELTETIANSSANQQSQAEVRASYEEYFLPRLRQLTGIDGDTDTMFNLMDYLYWANLSELPLRFELTDDDLNWINASTNSYIWRDRYSSDEDWSLLSYEWLMQMIEFSNVYLEGADWRDQPYFTKYFTGETFPKFMLFSAHSETVYPFLQAMFDVAPMEDTKPADAFFMEFFTDNTSNTEMVRAHHANRSWEVTLPLD